MRDKLSLLVPQPQEVQERDGVFSASSPLRICLASPAQDYLFTADYLVERLNELGLETELTASPAGGVAIHLHVDPALLPRPESYRLLVDQTGVMVTGADRAGLFYGVVTLCQLVQLYTSGDGVQLPHLKIVDWPDFPHRGIMLDISRDRVPSMETLFDLIDLAASLKLNQFQLYMEHTFAYAGHEEVWSQASPLTGEEVLTLDAYARERFVELVPNQNSLGHMHRWLKHDRYRPLAEVPEGVPHPFHPDPEPFSLCPEDPGSLELIRDLYDQLLPHFSSRQFNVGLDETFDIGMGRSKAACEERGGKRVYLDYLLKVHDEVRRRGRVMQFWGDIIIQEPSMISELPKDAIALEWGYDAAHPFEEHGQHFANAGISFYVCPGVSSWNSLAGRTDNALANLRNAAVNGKRHGAIGYLITDWGDRGHMQPLPISYLGYLVGAAYAWNVSSAANDGLDVPTLLDVHIYRDQAGVMGRLAYDLGNVYQETGVVPHNGSALFWQLILPSVIPEPDRVKQNAVQRYIETLRRMLQDASFDSVPDSIDRIMASLDRAQMERDDADVLQEEFRWVADTLRFAAKLGSARKAAGPAAPIGALPASTRAELAAVLKDLMERYRRVWLARDRPGGLDDSLVWCRRLLEQLEA